MKPIFSHENNFKFHMRFALLFLSLLFISSKSIAQTTLVKVIFIVEDFDTHKGVAGALVTVRQTASTQPTLADGKVTFNNVPVGEIEYFIMKEGYQFETGRVNVSTDEKTNIFRIPISKIDDKKILVTGEVTDSEGRDVKDAWVEVKIADQMRTVMTDASGNYYVDIAPSAKFPSSTMRIEVKKADCKKAETVDIPRTNVVYKDFKLSCSTKDDEKPVEQPVSTTRLKAEHIYEDDYFTIQLRECKRQAGSNLQVKLVMTAKDDDYTIWLYGSNSSSATTKIYDNRNNMYLVYSTKIANKTSTGDSNTMKFIQGVPTDIFLIFRDIDNESTALSLLEISFTVEGTSGYKSAKLRNIQIK